MKVLTVRQPWAWAIAEGHKTVENRSRPTKHRGPLAIHAGAAWAPTGGTDGRVLDAFWPYLTETQRFSRWTALDPAEHLDRIAFSAVIATVNVVDCHAAVDCHPDTCCPPWGDNNLFGEMWHWVLADAVKLAEPIPVKGRLGLWDIEIPAGVS